MNTIVVELFVHPWWVDVLVILGMITFVCGILMGIKSIWYCMRNAQIMKTANDYNQKLSNTSENQSEPNIPMQLTENAIFAAQDRLAIPEMIMGDKLEILTENDTDINDENNKKNNKNNKKTTGPTNNNNNSNNTNNTNSNDENNNEAQYVEYESAEDNKQHDIDDIDDIHNIHAGMDHLDISTIEDISAAEITRRDKKKRSRHRADPSLGGLMNSIDGMMTSLRNVTSMHLSNAGSNVIDNLTDIELDDSDVASSDNFSDGDDDNEGQSDSDQLHSRDLRQSLKLAGASSFILKQLDPELLRRQSTLGGGDAGGCDGDNETSVGETSVVYADDIDVDDIDEDVDDVDEPGKEQEQDIAAANSNDEIVNNISKGDKQVMICGTIDEESVDTEGGMIYLNESGSDDGQDSDKSF